MMMYTLNSIKKNVTIFSLVLLAACSSGNKEQNSEGSNDSTAVASQNSSSDAQTPDKTVANFLKWYSNNTALQRDLVNAKEGTSYSVNFEETEKYLEKLKATGFISDKYIEERRAYFKNCDQRFKENPMSEGPPEGFESDFIMLSQEYDEDLKNVEKATITTESQSANEASLKVSFPNNGMTVNYKLSKNGDAWKIDKISNQ